jgi:hypothetical protein
VYPNPRWMHFTDRLAEKEKASQAKKGNGGVAFCGASAASTAGRHCRPISASSRVAQPATRPPRMPRRDAPWTAIQDAMLERLWPLLLSLQGCTPPFLQTANPATRLPSGRGLRRRPGKRCGWVAQALDLDACNLVHSINQSISANSCSAVEKTMASWKPHPKAAALCSPRAPGRRPALRRMPTRQSSCSSRSRPKPWPDDG